MHSEKSKDIHLFFCPHLLQKVLPGQWVDAIFPLQPDLKVCYFKLLREVQRKAVCSKGDFGHKSSSRSS